MRLTRIKMAKNSARTALITNKRAMEERMERLRNDLDLVESDDLHHRDDNIFQLQQHHLLTCLERTTVRWSIFQVEASIT